MRELILAAFLQRAWENDQHEFRRHFSRQQWLHSIDGCWAAGRFDRLWPTYWVARHPEVAA